MSDWRDSGTTGGERPPWAPEAPGPATSSSWFASGRIWPVAVGLSLLVVVCVNLAFVYIAVTGADQVVPSYVEEER